MKQQYPLLARSAAFAALCVPALMLSACGGGQGEGNLPDNPTTSLSCKTGAATDFVDGCTLEWLAAQQGEDRFFLIHNPDGGFRKFIMSPDGARVNVADGAEPLIMEGDAQQGLTLSVGGDRYRLSAQDMQAPVITSASGNSAEGEGSSGNVQNASAVR